jgi:hypothetical protein
VKTSTLPKRRWPRSGTARTTPDNVSFRSCRHSSGGFGRLTIRLVAHYAGGPGQLTNSRTGLRPLPVPPPTASRSSVPPSPGNPGEGRGDGQFGRRAASVSWRVLTSAPSPISAPSCSRVQGPKSKVQSPRSDSRSMPRAGQLSFTTKTPRQQSPPVTKLLDALQEIGLAWCLRALVVKEPFDGVGSSSLPLTDTQFFLK